jgi:hypothetical protein
LAKEELQVIQAVSSTKRSFVLTKGISEGVSLGQEVIISNENVNIVCRAVEVNRNYSLWEPVDPRLNIPFKRDDIVSFNPHSFGNIALNIDGIELPESYKKEFSYFRDSNNWSMSYGYAIGLYQTSSEVSRENSTRRKGSQFQAEYHWRFQPEFELAGGMRYDIEVSRIEAGGNVDIESTRLMATASITYHLLNLSEGNNNWYVTLTGGIGNASTTINEETSKGNAFLIPELRVGYLVPFTKTKALKIEASVENITSSETFESSGSEEQNNSIVNSKLTIGLRF